MNFFDKFAESRRNVMIYVFIKLSISGYMLYLFFTASEMAHKIILLACVFILLMAMFPIVFLHYMITKQKKKEVNEN